MFDRSYQALFGTAYLKRMRFIGSEAVFDIPLNFYLKRAGSRRRTPNLYEKMVGPQLHPNIEGQIDKILRQ